MKRGSISLLFLTCLPHGHLSAERLLGPKSGICGTDSGTTILSHKRCLLRCMVRSTHWLKSIIFRGLGHPFHIKFCI
ncbi:hypothetical protein BS47DRAFT_251107 [Hydnum rufescens UP504]|uniref:Secreted protein n=1 Tax=Hydnum rufescens UP504 TaxID=1448309 RepID=A0A9P6AMB9_9AGAM|nr:hypothetical protein BS47DRAFT_251107 [Hydnum rufescens UP504]